ncbi:MAG: TonB-dependent receptor plug domain-containing protein [Campylobacterales bacterium]
MRGFKSGHTVVLIDGVRLNDPTSIEAAAAYEHLMVSDIERIEVVKGAMSGVWGADAAAGVINIVTKRATQGLVASVDLMGGSYGTAKGALSLSYKDKVWDFYVGVSRLVSDGFSAQAPIA